MEGRVRGMSLERQVDWLIDRITVEPVHDTRLVNIHVEHSNPRRAVEIADLVAGTFAEFEAGQRATGNAGLVSYLTEQLGRVKEKIQRTEQGLLRAGEGDPFLLEERLKQLSQAISEQQKQAAVTNRALARARDVYKERHPRLIALETEHQVIRESIESNEREMRSINEGLQRHSVAQSELKSDRELHSLLLGKLQEAEINGKVQTALVQVVQPAAAGRSPVRPRKALNLLVCMLAGLLAGLGLAFLKEYFRRTIRTPDDVSDHLQLPVLGLIPKVAQP